MRPERDPREADHREDGYEPAESRAGADAHRLLGPRPQGLDRRDATGAIRGLECGRERDGKPEGHREDDSRGRNGQPV